MKRFLKLALSLFGFAFTCIGTLLFFSFFYFSRDLPNHDYLRLYNPPVLSRLYAADGSILKEYANQRRIFVPITEISPMVIKAFLAAEDKNFYTHPGVDLLGIVRAVLLNTIHGNWQQQPTGASTITQQLAKNFFLNSERSFIRKIKEAILAVRIENALGKDRILELYLNQIYLGGGSYGVAAAALTYFNKSLKELTTAEIAFLAGLPKAPTSFQPTKNLARAKARRNWVLERLTEDTMEIQDIELAKKEPILLHPPAPIEGKGNYFVEEVRRILIQRFGDSVLYTGGLTVRTTLEKKLQEKADEALQQGLLIYDKRHGWRGPIKNLSLNTQLENEEGDPNWMLQLQDVPSPPGLGNWELVIVIDLNRKMAKIGFKDGRIGQIRLEDLSWARAWQKEETLGPEVRYPQDVLSIGDVIAVEAMPEIEPFNHQELPKYKLQQIPTVSGALVAMDPQTGRILAMSGGYNFELSQFNCATQANRQAGSAFKTFVYMAALEKGYTPETKVLDAPLYLDFGGDRGTYSPRNMSRQYYGPTPLYIGFGKSRNVVTVRLAQQIGIRRVAKIAERFGVIDKMPRELAMALGAGETTVLRLTTAYAMIANGGKRITPTYIDRIQDRWGRTLYHSDENICKDCRYLWRLETTSPYYLPQIQEVHKQLINPKVIKQIKTMLQGVVTEGTAKTLKELNHPIAGKTGTTNDYKDAWFIGFTEDLVVGIFVGFPIPRSLGEGETGSKVAVPIFKIFMEKVLREGRSC